MKPESPSGFVDAGDRRSLLVLAGRRCSSLVIVAGRHWSGYYQIILAALPRSGYLLVVSPLIKIYLDPERV